MTIQAILFDKDGTLIDFHRTWAPALSDVLGQLSRGDANIMGEMAQLCGFDLKNCRFETHSTFISASITELVQQWAPLIGRADDPALEEEVNLLFGAASCKTVCGFDSTETVLKILKATGFHLGIATNDTQANAQLHMNALEWNRHFSVIMGYDSGHGAKPGPGMVHAFADHHDVQASNIAMVGDSLHDLTCGKNANALCIGVTTGPATRAELAPMADYILDDLLELPGLLVKINSSRPQPAK